MWGHINIGAKGIFIDTLKSHTGCDSIVETNLEFKRPSNSVVDTSVCIGEALHINNVVYNDTGVYVQKYNNRHGCDSLVEVRILKKSIHECGDSCYYYLPNVFSPNGDGINDAFYIHENGIRIMSLSIYNRWGDLIFQTQNQPFVWSPDVNNIKVQAGTYVYVYYIECPAGVKLVYGDVTLIR